MTGSSKKKKKKNRSKDDSLATSSFKSIVKNRRYSTPEKFSKKIKTGKVKDNEDIKKINVYDNTLIILSDSEEDLKKKKKNENKTIREEDREEKEEEELSEHKKIEIIGYKKKQKNNNTININSINEKKKKLNYYDRYRNYENNVSNGNIKKKTLERKNSSNSNINGSSNINNKKGKRNSYNNLNSNPYYYIKEQQKRLRQDKQSDMVKLNVGGKSFCTSICTLTKCHNSMLSAMFSGNYSPFKNSEGYFIDRDGTHFRYILNYLRDGYVILPEDDVQMLKELMVEAEYYQIPGLIKQIQQTPVLSRIEYITIRYLPASTYDGWPVRIEGPLESHIIKELNGGTRPPEKETPDVRNMYGQASTGWKVRGIFLTKIMNIIASYGWVLITSNGSGGGKSRNFAEMYVFCRKKNFRKTYNYDQEKKRLSSSYNYSRLFPSIPDYPKTNIIQPSKATAELLLDMKIPLSNEHKANSNNDNHDDNINNENNSNSLNNQNNNNNDDDNSNDVNNNNNDINNESNNKDNLLSPSSPNNVNNNNNENECKEDDFAILIPKEFSLQ